MTTESQATAHDPEADKAMADRFVGCVDESRVISPFLDYLRGRYVFAEYNRRGDFMRAASVPSHERLLADYFGIDLDAVERHRARILADLQARGGNG